MPTLASPRGGEIRPTSATEFIENSKEASRRAGETIRTAFHRASDAMTFESQYDVSDDPTRLSTPVGQLSPDLHVEAARLADLNGNLAEATVQYERALNVDPNNRRALIGYARLNERQSDVTQAVALYQRAIQAHPNHPTAYNDLGLCYALHGRTQEGLTLLGRAVQMDPQNKRFRNNLAIVLVDAERYDEALAQLQAVHTPAEAHHNLACLLSAHGKEDLAAQHFAQARQYGSSASTQSAAAGAAIAQHQGAGQAAAQSAGGSAEVSPVTLTPHSPWQSYSPESDSPEAPSVRTATLEQDSAAVVRSDVQQVEYAYDSREPATECPGDTQANIDGSGFGTGAAGTPTHLPPVD